MALILLIDTSTRICSAALGSDGNVLAIRETNEHNAHSSSLGLFIEELIRAEQISMNDLQTVAVSRGPGSYTGLRIGVSTAKALCYAMDIPLIAIDTLKILAYGMRENHKGVENVLFCPMIDARRMEVYDALYDKKLNLVREIRAEIITQKSFSDLLNSKRIVFGGDGSEKCKKLFADQKNALFPSDITLSSSYMAFLAEEKYRKKDFEDVAYFEPYYLKDFVAGKPRVKGL